jgi:hypothetical protein
LAKEKEIKVGDRVRVKCTRSDGFVYGTGVVTEVSKHSWLTHLVQLDKPPTENAPDEWGYRSSKDPATPLFWNSDELELLPD